MKFLLEWTDATEMLGLVEFHQSPDKTRITDFTGLTPDPTEAKQHNLFTINYGAFTRK